ncbi:MAG: glycosyltransferase family 2 protein [Chitinophagales bacterium]
MPEALVSIIMPAYNAAAFIGDSIQSVVKQSYANWELIIVDDLSTDNTSALIQKYAADESRIRHITLKKNSGSAIARNTGIDAAHGKYIAFLDADDLWDAHKLERQVRFMQDNNISFSCTWYEHIDIDGHHTGRRIKAPTEATYRALLKHNTVGCLTAMYDADNLGKMHMPDIRKRQDYGLWLDITKRGEKVYCLPESLAWYRQSSSSLSGNKFSVLKYNWILLRSYQKLSFGASLYYFFCFLLYKGIKYLRA